MKFNYGYWLVREGVTPAHPAQVEDFVVGENRLTVYAATRKLVTRGNTLDTPLLTVELSAPLEGVIRVRLTNYRGGIDHGPHFHISEDDDAPAHIEVDDETLVFQSGSLSARIARGDEWRIDYSGDGVPLTSSGRKCMGSMEVAGAGHFMHERLRLGVGELVYGLGERFTPFIKNGQVVDIWNEDGGTASEIAYKNIPFYLTNRGYGVFVNNPGPVSFEVGSETVESVQFSVPGQTLEYFIIYGPSPRAILRRYTALLGKPALPPAWSFGLWLSTSFTTDYDEATVTSFVQGMADRNVPLHVFHFDCFWMRQFNWCDFQWDDRVFPDPVGMLARLKARGLRICVWINPYIAQRSSLFAEGSSKGYLLKKSNGDTWQWDRWQAGMGLVDFTNPDACVWYADKLRALLDMGVDCFKTDFGERIPTDVVYFDGADPVQMHNYYTHLYNQTVFDLLREVRGEGEAVLFARSATAGGQQFPVHWGGDCESTFEAMAATLRAGLSFGLSGFGFWSHDIGGFEGTPPAAIYKRWVQFGLLSSHSRLHGSSSYRVPWVYDEEAVDVLRQFTCLKARLMPYLYAQAVVAQREGIPVLRAMLLEFPDDPACETLDRQYMLGDSLLVAPIFTESGEVTFYLPAGRWTHLLTGNQVEGGRWVQERHDFDSLPLYVRPNHVIPLGNVEDRPDYDYADGVTLALYELEDGHDSILQVPGLDNDAVAATFHIVRSGDEIAVKQVGSAKGWMVRLANGLSVKSKRNRVVLNVTE